MKKVLIVDDDKTILGLLKETLEDGGYEVVIAGNGIEGINKVKKEKPELVIVDIMMPHINGYQMIFKIINEELLEKIPPFIILTVRSKELDKGISEKIGAHAYLTKPVSSDELLSVVKKLCPV